MSDKECLGPWVAVKVGDEVVGKLQIPDDLYPFHKHGNPSRPCADVTISLEAAKDEYERAIDRVQKAALEAAFWAALLSDVGKEVSNA